MHDSDWFSGECPCTDVPCKRAVAAQKRIEAEEALRTALIHVYYDHHGDWPKSSLMDELVKAIINAKREER